MQEEEKKLETKKRKDGEMERLRFIKTIKQREEKERKRERKKKEKKKERKKERKEILLLSPFVLTALIHRISANNSGANHYSKKFMAFFLSSKTSTPSNSGQLVIWRTLKFALVLFLFRL